METRRLYVGGLSHSVTDKDLKDRFGKFGKVESVELKTRADEQGVPYKTFGYINITLSDSDLKKCQTVLNKSQWKGGTLQIEPAKESFLQRVSQERQEAARLSLLPPTPSPQQQILSSLRDAGVCDFTMKSAVPGTEIPGHKDWVVGKFGRVLPVMQLKRCHGDGAQTLKYDPSKYGHNLRVLAPPPGPEATPTPVCKLTWALEGGDDDISRKRRGEFPPFTVSKKKSRPSTARIGSCNGSSRPIRALRPPLNSQSDEEQQQVGDSSHNAPGPEDDTLEVVSTDFFQSKRKDEDECDSADTDEIFSSLKPPTTPNKMATAKIQKKTNGCRSKYDSTDDEGEKASGKKSERKVKKATKMVAVKKIQKPENKVEDGGRKQGTKKGAKGDKERTEEMSQGGKETTEETSQGGKERIEETSQGGKERIEETRQGSKEITKETSQGETDDSDSDHDYESLFSNVMRLEMSLCDLRTLAHRYAPETPAPAILNVEDTSGTPKTGTTPEEILEAILQGGSSDEEEENKRRKKRKRGAAPEMSLPAFKGTGALQTETQHRDESSSAHTEASTDEEEDEGKTSEKESSSSDKDESSSAHTEASTDEEEDEGKTSEKESSSSDKDESSSAHPDQEEPAEESCSRDNASAHPPTANRRKTVVEEAELQRRANERRLAAVTQRQKEAEQSRRLIQGALYTREGAPGGSGGKHIVFGSDDEEEEEPLSANQNKIQTLSAPRLFDSDEDEEDEERLEIREEFEGSVGHKLMALQSRFGADERFRMDGRFLDDAEEECSEPAIAHTAQQGTLQQEKQKNLNILHSVLGPCSTASTPGEGNRAKALTFRDVSALHYDPSKQEHAAFEKKLQEPKESKASRRKKREEAQKLPEVSKEIYFELNTDLKSAFGKGTEERGEEKEEEEERTWDQAEEKEGKESGGEKSGGEKSGGEKSGGEKSGGEKSGGEKSGGEELGVKDTGDMEKDQSSVFRFSFFGDDPEPTPQPTEYKVQRISAPKLSWQQDPRLNDSSDEEEEERGEEEEEGKARSADTSTEETTAALFFFCANDTRLTDGPQWFCRTSLDKQRESWDQTRTQLRQDCKKKHKDARRKLRVQR